MKKICINCAPLANKITGIERVLYENIKRIDILNGGHNISIEALCPDGIKINLPPIKNMKIVKLKSKGKKIDYLTLAMYLKKNNAVYFSLHGGFCLQKGAVVCTHDIRPLIYKSFDPFKFRLICTINAYSSKFLADKIITVSQSSKKEMCEKLKLKQNKVEVIYNGWEHISEVKADETIWDRLSDVKKKDYYYSLSSRAPHKNFKWIEEVARRNSDNTFLVAGNKWRDDGEDVDIPPNMKYLGYVTDSENIELMRNCKAFLHPSKYEGFGITPLEALACGATICVADIKCLREIFGKSAHYFNADDYNVNLDILVKENVENPDNVLNKFTWDRSSHKWYELMLRYSR